MLPLIPSLPALQAPWYRHTASRVAAAAAVGRIYSKVPNNPNYLKRPKTNRNWFTDLLMSSAVVQGRNQQGVFGPADISPFCWAERTDIGP